MARRLLALLVLIATSGAALGDGLQSPPPQILLGLPNTWTQTQTFSGAIAAQGGGTVVGLSQLLLNGSTPQPIGSNTRSFAVLGTTTDSSSWSIARWSADSNPPSQILYKSRGAAIGTLGAVTIGDVLGSVNFIGDDGATSGGLTVAQIRTMVTCTFTSGSGCGALIIQTRNTTGSLLEHFRVTETGAIALNGNSVQVFDAVGNLTTPTGAFGGCTIGTDVICGTGTMTLSGTLNAANFHPTSATCAGTYFNLSATNTLGGCINSVLGVEWAPGGEKIHVAGSASNSPLLLDGAVLTGGTGTTNFPAQLIQPAGTAAVSTWSINGTGLGMNMPSGFTGMFLDFHKGGAVGVFTVDQTGQYGGASSAFVGSGAAFYWNGRALLRSPADGILKFTNQAETDFSRLQLGGTTAAFPAIKRNSTALNFRLADDSADAPITAGMITFSGGLKSAGGSVVLTGTGTPTCGTAACTDDSGTVISGSTATSVVITFSSTKANVPTCNVSAQTQLVAFAYATSTTAITITQTATTGEKIDYVCFQH